MGRRLRAVINNLKKHENPAKKVLDFFSAYPVAEIVILIIVFILWNNYIWCDNIDSYEPSKDEREIGAFAVKEAITAAITGSSIILAVIGAIIGLGVKNTTNSNLKNHLRIAGLLAVFSIIIGAVNLSFMPSRINVINIAKDYWITIFGIEQLLCFILCSIRMGLYFLWFR